MNFKKYLKIFSYTFFIIGVLILFYKSKFFGPSIVPTMALPTTSKTVKYDLNGDNSKDLIYITAKDNKYYIEISINNKTFFLNEKQPLNTLGNYYEFAPLQLNINDISRDNLPEIFIQSFDEGSPIQHIYTFSDNEFKDIFCSTNNSLGILDSKNTKSPKYISFDLDNIDETLQKHMLLNSTPKNISYDDIEIPGISTINNLITYIATDTPIGNIFFENTPQSTYNELDSLDKSEYNFSLLDCFFLDTAWNLDGSITNLNWKIRIKADSIESREISLLELNVSLGKIDNKFLINNLKVKKITN